MDVFDLLLRLCFSTPHANSAVVLNRLWFESLETPAPGSIPLCCGELFLTTRTPLLWSAPKAAQFRWQHFVTASRLERACGAQKRGVGRQLARVWTRAIFCFQKPLSETKWRFVAPNETQVTGEHTQSSASWHLRRWRHRWCRSRRLVSESVPTVNVNYRRSSIRRLTFISEHELSLSLRHSSVWQRELRPARGLFESLFVFQILGGLDVVMWWFFSERVDCALRWSNAAQSGQEVKKRTRSLVQWCACWHSRSLFHQYFNA